MGGAMFVTKPGCRADFRLPTSGLLSCDQSPLPWQMKLPEWGGDVRPLSSCRIGVWAEKGVQREPLPALAAFQEPSAQNNLSEPHTWGVVS